MGFSFRSEPPNGAEYQHVSGFIVKEQYSGVDPDFGGKFFVIHQFSVWFLVYVYFRCFEFPSD